MSLIDAWINPEQDTKKDCTLKESEKEANNEEKSRVWVMLTDDDKLYCKRMAKKLKEQGVIKTSTYSDFIEYIIKTTKSQNL